MVDFLETADLGRIDWEVVRDLYSELENSARIVACYWTNLDSEVEEVVGVGKRDLDRQREFELGYIFLQANLCSGDSTMNGG